MTCPKHRVELKLQFLELLILENIFQLCVHINRILTGAQTTHGHSILKQRAFKMYSLHRSRTLALQKS